MKVNRSNLNPLISTKDVKPYMHGYEVIGAFNAGTAVYNNEIILLLRVAERPICADANYVEAPVYNSHSNKVECLRFAKNDNNCNFSDPRMIYVNENGRRKSYLTSISHLRVAKSKDGETFVIEEKPFLSAFNKYTALGIEDPRITQIGDTYYITFSAVSHLGIVAGMVSTKDFISYKDEGNILHADNKDVAIFPEKINGKYFMLHRPSTSAFGRPEMWVASSPDLQSWGNHCFLAGLRENKWDSERMGAGAVPFKTKHGWLEIYHGATTDNRYCLGAMLLDLNDPSKILARSDEAMLVPQEKYECEGFFGDVLFTCGVVTFGDEVKVYYGASDETTALLTININDILEHLGVS